MMGKKVREAIRMVWLRCKGCDKVMNGICDYSIRDICEECGGEAKLRR